MKFSPKIFFSLKNWGAFFSLKQPIYNSIIFFSFRGRKFCENLPPQTKKEKKNHLLPNSKNGKNKI